MKQIDWKGLASCLALTVAAWYVIIWLGEQLMGARWRWE